MNEILVTEDGYNQFIKILNQLEKKLNDNGSNSTEACVSAVGDGWHDNFSFEALMEDGRKLNYQLNQMNKDKNNLKIIKDKYINDVVNINDIVKIKFIFSDNEYEEDIIKLTGNYLPVNNEITLNSPLGKTIYKQKIGSKLEYKVNDSIIKIEIKKIQSKM